MPDPKMFLDVTGTVTADMSGGYTRFTFAGPPARFIGVETSQIQPGSNATASAGGFAHAVVPILSRLAISDYPLLPPPLQLASPIGFHLPLSGHPVVDPVRPGPRSPTSPAGPRPLGYHLTDGTPLTVTEEDGQVTGLSGKSDLHSYSLTTSLTTVLASGRHASLAKVTWLVANLRISKDGAAPFTFGFSYAPEAFLLNVHSFCGNVVNSVLVDLAGSVVEKTTGNVDGVASLTRTIQYYGDSYSSQNLVVPATTYDAQFHLANEAALWPYLPDVAMFSDAFAQLGGQTPQLSQSPFVALGSLNDFEPPPAVTVISEQMISSIIPALGPLAASCLSSDDQAASLKAAAIWLGRLLLSTATGKAAVEAAAQAYYTTQYAHRLQSSTSPGSTDGVDPKPDPVMMDG